MDRPAKELLMDTVSAFLQAMARAWGLQPAKKKADVAAQLAPTLYDPERITQALARLSAPERALVDQLILAGGATATESARGHLEGAGLVARVKSNPYSYSRPAGSLRPSASPTFVDVVARAALLGLVFTEATPGSMANPQQPGLTLFIPERILTHLPPVTIEPEVAPAPSREAAADPVPLLRDCYVLLSFAEPEPIPLTTRGAIPKRTLVRIDESLREPEGAAQTRGEEELGRLPLLRALAEDLELLIARPGALVVGDAVQATLARPAGERQQQLFDAYCQTTRWCELPRIPNLTIKGPRVSVRSAPAQVVAARRQVIAEIATLPEGEWIPLAHLTDRLRQRAYEFLFSRSWPQQQYYGYSSWYKPLVYAGYNPQGWTFLDIADEAQGWNRVEGGMIRVMITEALHWLGVVELGYDDAIVTSFRVTPAGGRLLRGEAPASSAVPPQVVVQPNFQIFAFEPTNEDILFMLDRFAERRRVDQASEYEVTRESVYRGQQQGLDTAAILAFLERVSTVEIPQNVRRSIEEWGAQYERITIRRGVRLLQTADAAILDDLLADPTLARLLGRRLTPTMALVPAAALRDLARCLLERGRLPALSEGPSAAPGAALRVDDAGQITFRQAAADIYLLGALRPFSAERTGGGLALTPESLRRGAEAGLSADDIIARLRLYYRGELPERAVALVRRWAKDWGHGALAEVTLLQVDRPETLRDLLADPELRPHLRPLDGSGVLATVSPGAVERVRGILAARGMVLGDRLRT